MSTILWTVPAEHPAFAGHFPGRPILPGVVLVDQAMRHAAAAIGPASTLSGLAQAKFFVPVTPGRALRFQFSAASATALAWEIFAGDTRVAAGAFTLAPAP